MKNSLKEIIEGIISIVEGMDGLAAVEYTTSYEIAVDNTKDFPRLFLIVNSPSNILEQYNQVSIDFLFLDIMTSDVDHIQKDYEIKSDMAQQASILFDILEDQGYFGEDINITLEPITGEYMDGLSGMGCTVPFAIEKPCFEDGVPVTAFMVTIDSPISGAEFEEGTDITVTQTFSRVNDDITRVDLVVDGVVEDSHFVAPFDADFILSGLELGGHSIYINAWEGDTLADKSNTVNLTVVRVPIALTISAPTEGQIFDAGDNITIAYSFDRLVPELTRVELWVDGVLIESKANPSSFVMLDVTEGAKVINVKAYDDAYLLAEDTVNVEVVSGYEAETIALMTALAIPDDTNPSDYVGLTNSDVWTIVNNRFVGYKANGLMTEIHAEWWMLGSSAVQHSYNAINPAAFQLTWFGGWVHTKDGAQGNKTNTYADTGFAPSLNQTTNSNGIVFVSGASNSLSGLQVQMGSFQSITEATTLIVSNGGNAISRINGATISGTNASGIGVFHAVRQSASVSKIFKNGSQIATGNSGGTLTSRGLFIGAFDNSGSTTNFSDQRVQNAGTIAGLSDAQVLAHQTLVDAFENALGRKTW